MYTLGYIRVTPPTKSPSLKNRDAWKNMMSPSPALELLQRSGAYAKTRGFEVLKIISHCFLWIYLKKSPTNKPIFSTVLLFYSTLLHLRLWSILSAPLFFFLYLIEIERNKERPIRKWINIVIHGLESWSKKHPRFTYTIHAFCVELILFKINNLT